MLVDRFNAGSFEGAISRHEESAGHLGDNADRGLIAR